MTHNIRELISFANFLADESSIIIKQYFRNPLKIDEKEDESGVKKMMERLQNAGKEGYNNNNPVEENHPDRPNPSCTISECSPAVWVPENKLCLLCLHRGQ